MNHVDNVEKNLPGRGKIKCKGPEVGSVFREQEESCCGWSKVRQGAGEGNEVRR